MFGHEASPGEFLYHYTTREAGLGSILPTAQVRLGLFAATNDPREAKDWWFGFTATTVMPSPEESARIFRDSARLAKEQSKVLCLTMDSARPPPDEIFGRGWAHSRMWAQYAGGHSGMCLIFDWKGLGERISETLIGKGDLYHGPVEYGDSLGRRDLDAFNLNYDEIRVEGLEAVVARHVRDHHEALFFAKGIEWSSESEYRWVLRNPTPAPEFVPIAGVLRGVCAGVDFPASDYAALTYQCDRLGADARQMHWRNGSPIVLPTLGSVPSPSDL